MSISVEKQHPPTSFRSLAGLTDRIFMGTVSSQVLLAFALAAGFIFVSSTKDRRHMEERLKQLHDQWESRIAEAVYIQEIISPAALIFEIPVVKQFENELNSLDIPATVKMELCSPAKSFAPLEFPLSVGTKTLSHCTRVIINHQMLSKVLSSIIFATLISLLTTGTIWIWLRRKIQTKVIVPLLEEMETASRDAALGKVAAQVAHDLGSPLSALSVASADLSKLEEGERLLIKMAITRLMDISKSLTNTYRSSGLKKDVGVNEFERTPELLSRILDEIVSEKRMEFKHRAGLSIQYITRQETYGIFADVNSSELKRVISNLVNNSIEAMGSANDSSFVNISLELKGEEARILIEDNGKGISPDNLKLIGKRGATFGKKSGNGLGMAHAVSTIESWGGKILVESQLGIGTKISLSLPVCKKKPSWFKPNLDLSEKNKIVIVDDDPLIHSTWDNYFKAENLLPMECSVLHLQSAEALRDYLSQQDNREDKTLFLIDQELRREESSGIELVKELGIQNRSILVTHRADERQVRVSAEAIGLPILPKRLATSIPLN